MPKHRYRYYEPLQQIEIFAQVDDFRISNRPVACIDVRSYASTDQAIRRAESLCEMLDSEEASEPPGETYHDDYFKAVDNHP